MQGSYKYMAMTMLSLGLLTACQHTAGLNAAQRYVSDGYAQQAQGQDWVMITLSPNATQDTLTLSVQSRSDIKKPTCQFEGSAKLVTAGHYQIPVGNAHMDVYLSNESVRLDSQDGANLNYYCSGGASLAGTYSRLP